MMDDSPDSLRQRARFALRLVALADRFFASAWADEVMDMPGEEL